MSDAQQPPPFPPELPPYPEAPPPAPRLPSSQRFPTWKQALVLFLGGMALALSACFGCLITVDSMRGKAALEEAVVSVFILLMGVGVIATMVGSVLVLMRILRALFAKKDESSSGSAS